MQNIITFNKKTIAQTLGCDMLLLALASAIPAFSHLTAIPLYQFNPMLLVLLGAMLLVPNGWNAFAMAVLIPWTSCLISGMPTPAKALCMSAEFLTVVTLFPIILQGLASMSKSAGAMVSLLVSIMAGKAVFYLLKAIVLSPAVLIGTSWMVQIFVVFAMVIPFGFLYAKRNN